MTIVGRGFRTGVEPTFDAAADLELRISVLGPDVYSIRLLGLGEGDALLGDAVMDPLIPALSPDRAPLFGADTSFSFNLAALPAEVRGLSLVVSV